MTWMKITLPMIAALARDGSRDAKAGLKAISEHDFSVAVREYAEASGWLVAYTRQTGRVGQDKDDNRIWRGSGPKGEPDLRMVRKGVFLGAELKSEKGTISEAQREWLDALGFMGRLWRPRDANEILETLA